MPVNHRDLHNVFPVHGSWGEWGPWTTCSRTCGRGLSISERQCNHPEPQNGGSYCTSRRRQNGVVVSNKKHRLCEMDTCDGGQNENIHFQLEKMCVRFARSTMFSYVEDMKMPCTLKCISKQVRKKFE